MSNLDRALCEKLGIEPTQREHQVIDDDDDVLFFGTHRDCVQWLEDVNRMGGGEGLVIREWVEYPALSTTGDGMVLLMEALEKHGWDWDARNGREPARVTFGVFCIALFAEFPQERRQHYATSASAPMALALAAAAALGIEVQP